MLTLTECGWNTETGVLIDIGMGMGVVIRLGRGVRVGWVVLAVSTACACMMPFMCSVAVPLQCNNATASSNLHLLYFFGVLVVAVCPSRVTAPRDAFTTGLGGGSGSPAAPVARST